MKNFRSLAAGMLLPLLLGATATAQTLDPTFKSLTGIYKAGEVFGLGPLQANGMRLVAGRFERLNGSTVSSLVRIDAQGRLDKAFSDNVGEASNTFRIKALPNGQYLLSHNDDFIERVTAGGITRSQVLRLNADGTADASLGEGAGPRYTTYGGVTRDFDAQPDGKIVLVGFFTHYNNVPAPGIVRLLATGEIDPTFSIGTGLQVGTNDFGYAKAVVVQPDGKIVVGGSFSSFNGRPTPSLVRLQADGSVDETFTSPLAPNSYIETLIVQPDGKLLVAGSFSVRGNSARPGLIRLLPSGTPDPSFLTPFDAASVTTTHRDQPIALQPDGHIVAVGYFEKAGTAKYVVRFAANGSLDPDFRADITSTGNINTVGVQANGNVLLGGTFGRTDGVTTPLLKLTNTGAQDLDFKAIPQLRGTINALARQPDGKLVVGGDFSEINEQPVRQLARLSPTGELDASFSASAVSRPSAVNSLIVQADGNILAGMGLGLFRFTPDGRLDPTFSSFATSGPSDNYFIRCIGVQADGRILIGGYFPGFSRYGTQQALLRLSSTGEHDPTFAPPFSLNGMGRPNDIDDLVVQPDGKVVAAGTYTYAIGNQQTYAYRVVRYDAAGALDNSFQSLQIAESDGQQSFLTRVHSMVLQPDSKLLLGGRFGTINGTAREQIARLNTTGALDPTFAPNTDFNGPVLTIALQPNGRLLVAGRFTTTDITAARSNLTRLLADGSTDESFAASASTLGAINDIMIQPDGAILLGGDFTTVNYEPYLGIARLYAPHVLPNARAVATTSVAAWPVPAHSRLHVALDQRAHPLGLELLDALGRPVRQQPATGATKVTLNVEQLPAGIYLLRVHYAASTITRRIVVE